MKTTFISTQSISHSTRAQIASLQNNLVNAQKEVVTGRHADVGNALGYRTSYVVSLRHEQATLAAITDTNALVSSRLDATQSALNGILDTAESFVTAAIAARGGDRSGSSQVVQSEAAGALGSLTQMLNVAVNGSYLFAGINTDQKVLNDYFADPAPANRLAVGAEFNAAFGLGQNDPGVESITASDMSNFLDTSFGDLFEAPAWGDNWSTASDQSLRARISRDQVVDVSVNANEDAFRKLAMAFTMVVDLGVEGLGDPAYDALLDKAIVAASEAIQDVTTNMSTIGVAQEQVRVASERMSIQVDIINTQIIGLEAVDPFEATTRVNSLLTQIELSYAMTSRIQGLSLLEYLR